MISTEHLQQQIQAYRRAAQNYRDQAHANDGAAHALEQLLPQSMPQAAIDEAAAEAAREQEAAEKREQRRRKRASKKKAGNGATERPMAG